MPKCKTVKPHRLNLPQIGCSGGGANGESTNKWLRTRHVSLETADVVYFYIHWV